MKQKVKSQKNTISKFQLELNNVLDAELQDRIKEENIDINDNVAIRNAIITISSDAKLAIIEASLRRLIKYLIAINKWRK